MITSAPSARSSRAFSCDILSGMVKMQRYPFTAAASASPTPVLPDVASTIKPPGLRRPSRSAASIIATPMRSFTDPPGLKNSALAYTGVRIPCVTRFSRTSGVQPMVSRILPYGLAWDGIGVPFRRRRVTPHLADRSHRRGGGSGSGTRGVRLPLRDGPARLRVAELDRLEERRSDGQTVAPGGSEAQLARARERRRVERGIAARFGHAARFGLQASRGIDEQAQDHVALDLLVVQPGRVLDRRVSVQGHRGLLVRRNAGRPASGLLGRGCLAAPGGADAQEAGERDGADSHGPSASCFFHAASRFSASSGDSVFTSSRSSSSSRGCGLPNGLNRPSWAASGGAGGAWCAT